MARKADVPSSLLRLLRTFSAAHPDRLPALFLELEQLAQRQGRKAGARAIKTPVRPSSASVHPEDPPVRQVDTPRVLRPRLKYRLATTQLSARQFAALEALTPAHQLVYRILQTHPDQAYTTQQLMLFGSLQKKTIGNALSVLRHLKLVETLPIRPTRKPGRKPKPAQSSK